MNEWVVQITVPYEVVFSMHSYGGNIFVIIYKQKPWFVFPFHFIVPVWPVYLPGHECISLAGRGKLHRVKWRRMSGYVNHIPWFPAGSVLTCCVSGWLLFTFLNDGIFPVIEEIFSGFFPPEARGTCFSMSMIAHLSLTTHSHNPVCWSMWCYLVLISLTWLRWKE